MRLFSGTSRSDLLFDPLTARVRECEPQLLDGSKRNLHNLFKVSLNRIRSRSIYGSVADEITQAFKAPTFTPEIVEAISRISTRLNLHADEESRLLWQYENNACSQNEFDALLPLFASIQKPQSILEIGPGFGRSVAFFAYKAVWEEQACIHLYDANGKQTKYKQKHYEKPPIWPDTSSFCGDLDLLNLTLQYNHIANYRIYDAARFPMSSLPGPYDLIYGFYSIGFHWSLEHYLDELDGLLSPKSVFICTLNKQFKPFDRLQPYSVRILECEDVKKGAPPVKLLAMSKTELPNVGRSILEVFQ